MSAFAFAVVLIVQGLVVPGQNGVVTGQVRTGEGAPAAGVRVVAQAAESGGPTTDGAAFASLAETDAQGRYRLEGVPPGRYYIAAGLVSALSYYPGVAAITEARAVMVTTGSQLTGMDFTLVRSAGVRVSGHLRGFPENYTPTTLRVALLPTGNPGVRLTDVPLLPGGKFEFSKVSPGSYNLLTSFVSNINNTRIEVGDRDVSDIEVKLPPVLIGRVVVEGGGGLPVQQAAAAAGISDPLALVRFQARRTTGTTTSSTPVLANGSTVFFLPEGEYQLVLAMLPLGYYVKSMVHGNVNLLESILSVTKDTTSEIHVTLTKTPPANAEPGVTVSGRVNGIPADGVPRLLWVTIQYSTTIAGLTEQRVAETSVQPDTTFEFRGVPPGHYILRPSSGGTQPITVSSTGLTGVELQYTAPRTIVLPVVTPPPPPPPPTPTIQISGKVVVIPGTAMPQGIRLRSYRLQQSPFGGEQSRINPDGTFQFQGALPGEFDLNPVDTLLPTSRNFTALGNQSITGIEVKVPVAARGRVIVPGELRSLLPSLNIRNVYDAGQTGGARSSPTVQHVTKAQPDGSFTVEVVFGEQNISVANVPSGFSVKSITYGSMDLLRSPLRVTGPLTSEILVTLEAVAAPR